MVKEKEGKIDKEEWIFTGLLDRVDDFLVCKFVAVLIFYMKNCRGKKLPHIQFHLRKNLIRRKGKTFIHIWRRRKGKIYMRWYHP